MWEDINGCQWDSAGRNWIPLADPTPPTRPWLLTKSSKLLTTRPQHDVVHAVPMGQSKFLVSSVSFRVSSILKESSYHRCQREQNSFGRYWVPGSLSCPWCQKFSLTLTRLRIEMTLYIPCSRWFNRRYLAALIDTLEFRTWLALLSPDYNETQKAGYRSVIFETWGK